MQIENVVLIKINKSYQEGMTPEELYEVTSHSWVASFETVSYTHLTLPTITAV